MIRICDAKTACSVLELYHFGEKVPKGTNAKEGYSKSDSKFKDYNDFVKQLKESVDSYSVHAGIPVYHYALVLAYVVSTQPDARKYFTKFGFHKVGPIEYDKFDRNHQMYMFYLTGEELKEMLDG